MQSARLRASGIIVLAAGIVGAGIVYWHGMQMKDDPALTGYGRPETRQMQVMYGTMGTLSDDFYRALARPDIQAGIILASSTVIAAACFFFARPVRSDH